MSLDNGNIIAITAGNKIALGSEEEMHNDTEENYPHYSGCSVVVRWQQKLHTKGKETQGRSTVIYISQGSRMWKLMTAVETASPYLM